jgi:ABC-2 type transport system permease protein
MKQIKTSVALFSAVYKDRGESYGKILTDVSVMFARFGLLILLYYYLFLYKGGSINGESLAVVSYSMFMYFAFMNISPRYLGREIQSDIRSGKIQDLLAKPYNYMLYRLSFHFGNRMNVFLINLIACSVFMFYFFGVLPIMATFTFWATLPVVLFFCFTITFLIFACLGLLSFWIEDIAPISWILDKFVMILGGSFVPIAFFPTFLKNIATYSPFGASQFLTSMMYNSWLDAWPKMILIQILWTLFFSLILYFLFKSAVRNVATNGG